MRGLVFLSALVGAMACNPSEDHPHGEQDASGADTSHLDAPPSIEAAPEAEAAAACNDLLLDAPAVGLTYDLAAPPEPTGGTIADGTYFLTQQLVYRTASGITIPIGRTKVVIAGTTWHEVNGDPEPGSVNPDRQWSYALVTAGTSLSMTRFCPSAKPAETLPYTAEATRFTLFVQDRGKTIGTVFTKQ